MSYLATTEPIVAMIYDVIWFYVVTVLFTKCFYEL